MADASDSMSPELASLIKVMETASEAELDAMCAPAPVSPPGAEHMAATGPVKALLVDERDVVIETKAHFFRIYDHEPASFAVSTFDLNTTDIAIAIAECKKFERPGHLVSLAAIVQLGTDRGAVFITGNSPGTV